jgi:hypothetical protein
MIDLSSYRRAYELGRLRDAALGTAAAAVPLLVARVLGHPLPVALSIVALLMFGGLRWRGRWWNRAATVGLAMGFIPFAVPVALSVLSRVECPPYCEPLCAIAGLIAGVGLGHFAREGDVAPILAGTALAIDGRWDVPVRRDYRRPDGGNLVVGVGVGRLRTTWRLVVHAARTRRLLGRHPGVLAYADAVRDPICSIPKLGLTLRLRAAISVLVVAELSPCHCGHGPSMRFHRS